MKTSGSFTEKFVTRESGSAVSGMLTMSSPGVLRITGGSLTFSMLTVKRRFAFP